MGSTDSKFWGSTWAQRGYLSLAQPGNVGRLSTGDAAQQIQSKNSGELEIKCLIFIEYLLSTKWHNVLWFHQILATTCRVEGSKTWHDLPKITQLISSDSGNLNLCCFWFQSYAISVMAAFRKKIEFAGLLTSEAVCTLSPINEKNINAWNSRAFTRGYMSHHRKSLNIQILKLRWLRSNI